MTSEWSLHVGHPPGTLALVLIVACVVLALLDVGSMIRRPPPPLARAGLRGRLRLVGLLALRLVAIACLLAVVLELQVRVLSHAGSGRRVVVLIDRSASMGIADAPADAEPGESTTRRWERVRKAWAAAADARERWRGEGIEVEVRSFGERSDPLTRAAADELAFEPEAGASELAPALVELGEADPLGASDGSPLAGVVVVSDGLVARDAATRNHLEALVRELGVPLTAVAAAGPTLRDVSLARLHVGEFAFVENLTEFTAELVAHGMKGEQASVSLLRDGELVETQRVRLGDDGELRSVRFEVAPDRTGAFVYEFRVEPLRDEASELNNRRAFVVKVLRDKVRVLHVAGRPDWDVRALRTLLKRDPNVELLSYYILRDWEDLSREDEDAPLSLIAFPTDELFHEQLGSFDLIVMHNFDAQAHGDYLTNIAQYVREGGSLVVIGGDLGVATGDFGEPAINELLPVDLRTRVGLEREPFAARLSEAGRAHPITAWLAEAGRADWSGLPPLDSFNRTSLSRRSDEIGAAVLLSHAGPGSAPLLAVAEPGKGRVMTLMTGSSWRLGFAPDLPLIDGARPYDLLWLGAVRWLLRDESAERLVLETSKTDYGLGEPIELTVRTLTASYAAESEVEVAYEITPIGASEASIVAEGSLTTDGLGRAATRIASEGSPQGVPLPAGAYAAEAWRAADERPDQPARRVFLVGAAAPELALLDGDPGTALLARLVEASGEGELVELAEDEPLPDDLPLRELDELERPATGRRDIAIWDGWGALVLLLGCFGGEWLLRRRLGGR